MAENDCYFLDKHLMQKPWQIKKSPVENPGKKKRPNRPLCVYVLRTIRTKTHLCGLT